MLPVVFPESIVDGEGQSDAGESKSWPHAVGNGLLTLLLRCVLKRAEKHISN